MIPNWLLQRSMLTPTRIALSFEDQQWTFAEMNDEALRLAEKLTANGISENSRVAILAGVHPEFVMMMYACMHVGCEMVLLNNRLTDSELLYQLSDAQVDVVLVDLPFQDRLTSTPMNRLSFSDIQHSARCDFTPKAEWHENDTMTIMYTSGTTGFPKGVRQTIGNHTSSAVASALNLGISPNDCWLNAMPLFHISGFSILVRSLLYGMTVRLFAKFDTEAIAQELVAGTVTHMSVVAVTLERIVSVLESSEQKVSEKFRVMLAGGGAVPTDYLKRALSCGIAVCQTYGMTETSSQTATLSNEDALRKVGSAGKPLFFNQIKIDGVETGEILVKGPHVTPGYIGKFANHAPTENGWLRTGDIGYFDEDGYLFILDRRSDLIISGGENIYPAEIENVLTSHPAVMEAGVCGIDHHEWGHVPIAFVKCKDSISSQQLKAHCQSLLAPYKVPHAFLSVAELPRNASNKLVRRELLASFPKW